MLMNAVRFLNFPSAFTGIPLRPILLVLCGVGVASAQNLLTVTSPDGQIEFRAFSVAPNPGEADRLAYQVVYKSKLLLDTSFLGFEIALQPYLGEKLGLMASSRSSVSGYRSVNAEYMQNGTTGRRLNLEVRAYDEGVAFRYIIPKSSLVEEIFIQEEDTEFHFAADPDAFPVLLAGFGAPEKPQSRIKLSRISEDNLIAVPFVAEQPGVGWISISQEGGSGYPHLFLSHSEDTTLITALPPLPDHPKMALDTTTPLVCPWRVVRIGPSRESVSGSGTLPGLSEK
jgi:alpha-glucosidase